MASIKIAFFDIDGTLASNRHRDKDILERIPASTMEALRCLKENDIMPVVATGRGRMSVVSFMDSIGMDSYIAANGNSLTYKGKEVYQRFLKKHDIEKSIAQIINLPDVSILLETTIGNVLCKDEYIRKWPYVKDQRNDLNGLGEYQTYHITIAGEDLKKRVQIEVPGIKARMVAPDIMNIFYQDVSKASGIEKLLEMLKLDKSQAVAFGDEENDLEMFAAVGISVAMGNAVQMLKDKATYVTNDVDADGIWNACKYFGLF